MKGVLDKLAQAFAEVESNGQLVECISMSLNTFEEVHRCSDKSIWNGAYCGYGHGHFFWGAKVVLVKRMSHGLVEVEGSGGLRHLALLWGDDGIHYVVRWAEPTTSGGTRYARMLEDLVP